MANWSTLKAAVANVIKANGNHEITGAALQNTLNSIINIVGANATFAGIATTSTNPGSHDGPVFYFATAAGTYANFNGLVLPAGFNLLYNQDGTWRNVNAFTITQTTGNSTEVAMSQKAVTDSLNAINNTVSNGFNTINNTLSNGVVGTITLDEMLGMGYAQAAAYTTNKKPCRLIVLQSGRNIGTLDITSDANAHVINQMFISNSVLVDGTFNNTHTDGILRIYYRAFSISSSQLERNNWTAWKELTPELAQTTGTSAEVAMSQKAVTDSLNTINNTLSNGVVGTITLDEMLSMTLPQATPYTTNKKPCRLIVLQSGRSVGTLDITSDANAHVINQMFISSCLLVDGTFTGSHKDGDLYIYYRAFSLYGGQGLEQGWTAWKELTPELAQTTGNSAEVAMSQKAVTDSLNTINNTIKAIAEELITNKKYVSMIYDFLINKVVNKQNRLLISFNGDSIIGSQLDDIMQAPGPEPGVFPPNMSRRTLARMFYEQYKMPGEDTQFRNLQHASWAKTGWAIAEGSSTFQNRPEVYSAGSTNAVAQITVSGYKFFKLVWSEYKEASYSFSVYVSKDGGPFSPPSKIGIALPDTVIKKVGIGVMYKYSITSLDADSTYTIQIIPVNAPSAITFWGCEFWNNPRLDVVVEARSNTTSEYIKTNLIESYYSDWHKPMLIISDVISVSDSYSIVDSSYTVEQWIANNAYIYEHCRKNGVPVLVFAQHNVNKVFLLKYTSGFASANDLHYIDIAKRMQDLNVPISSIVNSIDGINLSNNGNAFYFEALKTIFSK